MTDDITSPRMRRRPAAKATALLRRLWRAARAGAAREFEDLRDVEKGVTAIRARG